MITNKVTKKYELMLMHSRMRFPDKARLDKIIAKQEDLKEAAIALVDKAFGVPLFFELRHEGKIRYQACHRRRNAADQSKWVFSPYFATSWFPEDAEEVASPVAISLAGLYESLIRLVLPINAPETPLLAIVGKCAELRSLETERLKLANKIKREKSFKKKVGLNRRLNELKNELSAIIRESNGVKN